MKILAIDTSNRPLSVAILEDKRETVVNEYQKRKVKNLVKKNNF